MESGRHLSKFVDAKALTMRIGNQQGIAAHGHHLPCESRATPEASFANLQKSRGATGATAGECNQGLLEPDAQAEFKLPRSAQSVGSRLKAGTVRQKVGIRHAPH